MAYRGHTKVNSRGGVAIETFPRKAIPCNLQRGLEVEGGRGWMGNAVYRDLVQGAVMVGVEHLCLAVSNVYRYLRENMQFE
jgi:hypothetical protein